MFGVPYGWARLTLPQWKHFTPADWSILPVDVLGIQTTTYTYDPIGNRIRQRDVETGEITTNTYDDANRLLVSAAGSDITTYTYNENGNTPTIEESSGDITTNTWDCE
ncbi:MAG: hypothetical protein JWM11_94, partial [Planctomycetaceae bacterium]|nr:hypothetical protein [Planctomycetaceae bacterium]